MSPYEKIRHAYIQHPQEETFEHYVDWHLKNAFLFSTPEFFIMGREVPKMVIELSGKVELRKFPHALWTPDTWYIHAMAGDMSKAWSILPWPLPWIAFERIRGGARELTILPFQKIYSLSHPHIDETIATPQTA